MKMVLLSFLLAITSTLFGQAFVVRDIKSFGAKGDGRTNDHEAFQKAAAFFNDRGGNGRLVVSKGTYLVGVQTFHRNPKTGGVYEGQDLLKLDRVKNVTIEGIDSPVIRYRDELRYGSFDPATGKSFSSTGNFFKYDHIAAIRNAIELNHCENITIINLELNGNSDKFILGGPWGDLGRQLPHSGVWINNSTNLTINNLYAHHFGLDGIVISNATGQSRKKDGILISNSRFEYNARQGLSWVGGNELTVTKSAFNHSGKGKFMSAPGAGVDIEAEVGTVSNGRFLNCQFINNSGCGLLAEEGPSRDCRFINCLFWGLDLWSAWVRKPNFQFDNCTFHGSFVHGFSAEKQADATVFRKCLFEDKPYNGRQPYGNFLIETNYVKRMRFEDCTFRAHTKNVSWMVAPDNSTPEERYLVVRGKYFFKGEGVGLNDHLRCLDCSFEMTHPKTKKKSHLSTDRKGVVQNK